jgi:hypothetical protein
MDKVFGQLNVINTKTARRRATSLKQQGKQEEEWPSPDRMAIPVKNSTKTQQAIWEVIEKRVKGIKFKQKVDISHEAAQVMELPPAELVHAIEPIATGLAQAPATDDTLLVYTQCLLDAFRAQIVTQKGQTGEMAELRHIVGTWHRLFRGGNVTLIPGSMYRGGVQLDHYDVASLLLGDGYDGWLNGDLIYAILTITAHNQYVVPARAFDFWHQGNQPDSMFDVPDDFPSLIVPVHWGNHWALLIADRNAGQIYYLDSMEVEGRRQMAVASMRNFLNMHPGYSAISWQANARQSAQQTNTYDCGVWAVNNAWAWMDQGPSPTSVGLPERLQIGRAILAAAEVAVEAHQPVPTDEVEILGMRNLSLTPTRATTSMGHSFSSAGQPARASSRMPTPQREQHIRTALQTRQLRAQSGPSTRAASTATSRLESPELDQMIDTSAQVLRVSNPATPRAQQSPASSLSSAMSQFSTPPGLRSMESLVDTSRRVTARGSPMPRTPARENQEQQESARRRGTRSGKEF